MSNAIPLYAPKKKPYRANTHTHTNLSDGSFSPAEVKARYQAEGYQIVAFTDHEMCFAHRELTDDQFLALTAYEVAINTKNPADVHTRTYHLNLISRDPDQTGMVCHDFAADRDFWPGIHRNRKILSAEPRLYDVDYVNHLIEEANRAGYFVTLNHPTWSRNTYPEYIGLKGLWGVEVWNTACVMLGHDEQNVRVWNDFLQAGTKLFPVAADDFHHDYDAFGGWLMVDAPELTYKAVIAAMEHGDFYASTGPELHSAVVEDGQLRIQCSPCRLILAGSNCRKCFRASAGQDEPLLTEAVFDLRQWAWLYNEAQKDDAWLRITLEDAEGHHAYTRAYSYREIEAAL